VCQGESLLSTAQLPAYPGLCEHRVSRGEASEPTVAIATRRGSLG